MAPTRSRPRLDDFVAAARGDATDPQPLTFLTGFVGRGAEKGTVRIYPDPGLGRWIDVAEEDVAHSVPIADSPLGGSHLWLKGSATLSPGMAASGGEPGAAGDLRQPPLIPPTQLECIQTRPPFCVQAQAPASRIACPTLPPACFQQQAAVRAPTLGCQAQAAQPWLTSQFCAAAQQAAVGGGAANIAVFTDASGCPTYRVPCETAFVVANLRFNALPRQALFQPFPASPHITVVFCPITGPCPGR